MSLADKAGLSQGDLIEVLGLGAMVSVGVRGVCLALSCVR